ncbi:molybdenum cofactor biosynthesis protein MoaE [Actinoplanes sp. NPDC026623]|uniref:molybdenum cofactor biosynthesis protein MoaE n=1 Tax=Actinoplanes sp. NPDC026623 TaxID=3155610 RepID=UPI0033E1BC8F
MQVRVLYFGYIRERVAHRRDELMSMPDGSTLKDVLDVLCTTYPRFGPARRLVKVAVNEEMAPSGQTLRNGDVIAVIPPVAGGSGPYVRVTEDPLSLEQVVGAVVGPDRGGVTAFIGYVRGDTDGKPVSRLEYEAYRPMAEQSFADIIARCERVGSGVRVAVAHRLGLLEVGEVAVVIAAAAPHRAEAFQAARMCAELMKQETTIWKKEYGPDGEAWVGVPQELQFD